MANPFENILTNLFSNTVFAPPRAVQGAERAAALEAQALAQKQALELQQRQAFIRGLQGIANISSPGLLSRPEVANKVFSDPKLMSDLLVNHDISKPEDVIKILDTLVADPFKQMSGSPGTEIWSPDPLGRPEHIRTVPTTEQVDTQDKQIQAAARAEGIGLLSKWLGKGLSRQQVYEKAIGDKQFRKKYIEEGQGKEEGLKTLLELGTPKPIEPTTLSPGEGIQVPNAEGTGFVPGPQQPTAEAQRYTEIETRFGPAVAQELFRLAGPTMNPTEKQTAAQAILKANPGNRELEQTLLKIQAGVLQTSSYWDPIQQRSVNTIIDLSKPASQTGPVATGTSVQPPAGKGDLGAAPQQQSAAPRSPYLPQFTPPKPLPPGMTMPAGEAAFELGPPGAVSDILNNVFAPVGLATTNQKRTDAVAAFTTIADVSREYFQNSGRPLAADVQLVVSRLPKAGGITRGFFETPLKALSQLKALRGQIEKDMLHYGRILSRPDEYSKEVIAEAQAGFTRGENAIQYFPTNEELNSYIKKAEGLESQGVKGVGAEIKKRWDESFQGGQEIQDFLGEEKEKPETLEEEEMRLRRELDALDAPLDQDDPSEMDIDPSEKDELPFEPSDDKGIFSPTPNQREKELLDERERLQNQGYQPVPLGNGQFVEPAGQELVKGRDGALITSEQRLQEIDEELAVIADQKALHRRRLFTELSSNRAAQQTGLPKEMFHMAAGVQAEISDLTALPAAAVRNALIAIGAAKIMNPEWQSGRSTESLVRDYWQARGNVVEIPEGSISGRVGEGALTGATLAFGFAVAGPRIAAAKGPKALKAAKDWVARVFTTTKSEALVSGAASGGASAAAEEYAEQSGAGPRGKATAGIAAGILAPGKSLVSLSGRAAGAFKKPKTGPQLRPEGPGAQMVQAYGQQMQATIAKKATAQKGVLQRFTQMDPDKAIDKAMGGSFKGYEGNPEGAMKALRAVTMRDKDAAEGLRRGTMDWLFKKSGLFSPQFTPDRFAKVWNDPTTRRAYASVLPKATIKRIDDAVAAEMAISAGVKAPNKYKPLAKAAAGGLAIDTMTGSPGLATMLFVGRVLGAQGSKAAGASTLQTQTAAAEVGKGTFRRLYQKMFPGSLDASTLFREALLDPKFEATLLKRAGAVTAKAERKAAGAARRRRGAVIGINEAVDNDEVGAELE